MLFWRIGVIGAAVLALAVLERYFPLRSPGRPRAARWRTNAAMSLLTFLSAAVFVFPVTRGLLSVTESRGLGLLSYFEVSAFARWTLGFLWLDLSFYYWHRLNHGVAFLWRFHNVHHIDPDLDVSTGFRFHFGEVALSAGFRAVQLAVIGVPPAVFFAFEVVFQLGTFFHHSNVRLPRAWERRLNWLFVTPRMHGVHHSREYGEVHSNYSVVLSFWDRLHGTFQWREREETAVGVPGYDLDGDNRLSCLLWHPFRSQRVYWPELPPPRRAPTATPTRRRG